MLPVIISGNGGSMTQSFLNALQKSLRLNDLDDIMPETHFQSAINNIKRWEKDYPNTFAKFSDLLNEPVSRFIDRLAENDVNEYKKFIALYPDLSSGGTFNPFFRKRALAVFLLFTMNLENILNLIYRQQMIVKLRCFKI